MILASPSQIPLLYIWGVFPVNRVTSFSLSFRTFMKRSLCCCTRGRVGAMTRTRKFLWFNRKLWATRADMMVLPRAVGRTTIVFLWLALSAIVF